MPIRLISPIKKEFHLEKSDKEFDTTDGSTMVTIRQATQGDFELVRDLTSELQREYSEGKIRYNQRISFDDIRRKQVFTTLCGSNITDETGKKSLFKFEDGSLKDEKLFTLAWSKLPPIVAQEIHEKVLEMNPLWNEDGIANKKEDGEIDEEEPVISGEDL